MSEPAALDREFKRRMRSNANWLKGITMIGALCAMSLLALDLAWPWLAVPVIAWTQCVGFVLCDISEAIEERL